MAEATAPEMTMPKHGDFCWTEIATNNLEACKNFYSNVFGWELKQSKATGEDFEYQEFSATEGGNPMGGIYQITNEMFGEQMPPPHFLNYINVDNVDETTRQAFDLGAKIIKPPMDIPNVGRFSIIQDPTDGIVAFITLGGEK